jgi:type I restriction enzyme S subunit
VISRNSISEAFPIKRLGDVVEFLDSKRRPVTESERRAGPYPYYGANGIQGTIDNFIFDEPLVLLAEDGGHFDDPDRGIAYRISGKTWVNNHAHVLRPTSVIDLAYLCRVLENYDVKPFVTGTTRGKLTKAGASEIAIPLPPLAEQRRIAEVLDRAEALRAKRRAALAELDSLTQSLFLDLFGDPVTNPKGFPKVSLASLVREDDTINYGVVQPGDDLDEGIPLIRVGDLIEGKVRHADLKRIAPSIEATYKRSRLRGNEVLLVCVGATAGLVAIADETVRGYNIARAVARIPVADSCIPVFIAAYLRTDWTQRHFQNELRTVAQPTLNIKQICELPVLAPPIALQQEFARRVGAVEKLKQAQRAALAEQDALFATLQHRAFRGEL